MAKAGKSQISLDINGHINSIDFNSPLLVKTCIMNTKKWNQIPRVSIITGKNGMHSQLYKMIYKR